MGKKFIDNIRHPKECTSEASAPPVQKGVFLVEKVGKKFIDNIRHPIMWATKEPTRLWRICESIRYYDIKSVKKNIVITYAPR